MPKVRIGFSSDFVLTNSQAGIGTTNPQATLHVAGGIIGDFNISGDTTFKHSYTGLTPQIQSVAFEDTIGIATVGVGTFIQSYETESGNVDLEGQFNTVSEDIVVEDGKIFEVTETKNIGITTLGTQNVYVPNDSVVSVGTLESVTLQTHFGVPKGGTTTRPQDPKEGMVRFNDDLNTLEFYNGIEWRQFTYNVGQSGRGVFGGGVSIVRFSVIDYINIHSIGNAINFGDLTLAREINGQSSSSTRGVFGGGESNSGNVANIDYITLSSEGNAINFGNLSEARLTGGGCSSSTRGLWASGRTPTAVNTIDYIEISTLGNALDFGDTTFSGPWRCGFSSPTRGVWAGGGPVPTTIASVIEYNTISSKGNSIDYGDLSQRKQSISGFSNSTKGFIGGGYDGVNKNTIDIISISTGGNAEEFGNLSSLRRTVSGCSSQTRGLFVGGEGTVVQVNTIEYITIASNGNAQDFGDLTTIRAAIGACSDSHGGLGGF